MRWLQYTCYLLVGIYQVLPVTCYLRLVSCHLLLACYLLLVTCHLLLATCYLLLVSCHLLLATCYLLLATCYLLPVTCYMLLIISWYFQSDSFHIIIGYLKPLISCKRITSFRSCSATHSCICLDSRSLVNINFMGHICPPSPPCLFKDSRMCVWWGLNNLFLLWWFLYLEVIFLA